MLRDWTDSEKVNDLSVHSERFFVRLIMKVDDYGCFSADARLLKANLFPLLLDSIREADLLRWMAECQKAGLIVLYESKGKKYLQINDFKQRLDRARAKHPLPSVNDLREVVNEFREVVNDFPPETETETETEGANALVGQGPPVVSLSEKDMYDAVGNDMNSIAAFIFKNRPALADPYIDLWNLFAAKHKRPAIKNMPDGRKRKLSVRLNEKAFDFVGVLKKARGSDFLMGGNFFSFDWIIENGTNYLKVLEGNYANTQTETNGNTNNYQEERARMEEKTRQLAES
jgi:hypothetical protein